MWWASKLQSCLLLGVGLVLCEKGQRPRGWATIGKGKWYHEFCAIIPEWAVVDHDNTTLKLPDGPPKDLPYGWVAREHDFLDTVTGDVSEEWPVAFQQEVTFKTHYMSLVQRVKGALISHREEIGEAFENGLRSSISTFPDSLPPDFMEILLRIVKAPILLADRSETASQHLPAAEVLTAVRALFRSYAAASTQDAPAKMLFIIMGQTYDSYHQDTAYMLPQYMIDGLKGLFEGTPPCTGFGFTVDSHDLGKNVKRGHKAQSDLSVVAFIRHFFPDIQLDVLDPCRDLHKLSDPAFLDGYDVVVNGHFGPIGASLPLDKRYPNLGFAAFERALERTTAYVWNPPWIVAISNKSHIPLVLRKHGIPAAATIDVSIGSGDPQEIAENLIHRAMRDGWGTIFTKPHEQGYMRNLGLFPLRKDQIVDNELETRVVDYIKNLRELGLNGFCAQKYVSSFKDDYEMRLYFFNGKFGTAIGNKVDAYLFSDGDRHDFFYWDWFDFEGGMLNSTKYRLRDKLIPMAERALRVVADEAAERAQLPAGVKFHPLFRVDVGCCLDPTDKGYDEADGWFVNEAEALPNFNLDHFTRHLVNIYGTWNHEEWWPPFEKDAIMTKMVERAAAAWYPTSEHFALELARFVKRVVALRRQKTNEASRSEL